MESMKKKDQDEIVYVKKSKGKRVQKIETIQDLCNVVNKENVSRLSLDVLQFLYTISELKENLGDNSDRLEVKEMNWKDDGKVGMRSATINGKKVKGKTTKIKP